MKRAIERLYVNCSKEMKWTGMRWIKLGNNQFTVSVHCVIVCIPHLQDGHGALHLANKGGHAELVQMLVQEFGFPPDTSDNVSILIAHELKP